VAKNDRKPWQPIQLSTKKRNGVTGGGVCRRKRKQLSMKKKAQRLKEKRSSWRIGNDESNGRINQWRINGVVMAKS